MDEKPSKSSFIAEFRILFFLVLLPASAIGQVGVAFHQSNIPFLGINYEFIDRFRIEGRVGMDHYFSDLALEGILTYDFFRREDYTIYGGAGYRYQRRAVFEGIVVPVGMNIYPFSGKRFGFHIEVTGVFGRFSDILRGSWGIHYRFLRT